MSRTFTRSEAIANDNMQTRARILARQAAIDHAQMMRASIERLDQYAPRSLSDMLAQPKPSLVARMLGMGRRKA